MFRLTFCVVLAIGMMGIAQSSLRADKPAKEKENEKPDAEKVNVNDLSMEVQAMRMIYQLKLTPEQMKALRKVAEKTADKNGDREDGRASEKYVKALQTLRTAFVGAEEEAINTAEEELDEIHEAEPPMLDDSIEISADARARTPDVLRVLKAPQVLSWLAFNAEEVADPRDMLTNAVTKVRTLKGEEFNTFREEVAEEAGRLLAGIHQKKSERVHDAVFGLLTRAHDLGEDEVAAKLPALEKEVEEMIGKTSATDVMRNVIELAIAEWLSNPRLVAALDARLK
jgi:hypothetical protein